MTANRSIIHTESVAVRNGSREIPANSPFRIDGDYVDHRSGQGGILSQTIQISPAESVKRFGTGCRRWFAESVVSQCGNEVEFRFFGSVHLLVLYHEGARRAGETSVDGVASSTARSFVNRFTFVPAGHLYRERHVTSQFTRITFLYVAPEELAGLEGAGLADKPLLYREDSVVIETALKMKNAIEGSEAGGIFYLEALSSVLAHELSRPGETAKKHPLSRGGLANWQRTAVVRHIENHLSEQIVLATLAGLVRLSEHHFCRSFKRSFGVPPRRYQVQRRMESAKALIADRSLSITEIGLIVGYSQSSSFSDAFRKMTGRSPSQYRKQFE
jgi:AraC family transcriptional regulator